MAYLVLYGSSKVGNLRNIVATIPDVNYKIDKRVFDLNTVQCEGRLFNTKLDELEEPIIYTLHEDDGTKIHDGFVKNLKPENGVIRFTGEDFRKILESDVLLDFSQGTPDIRLSAMFEKVMTIIQGYNSFNINLVYNIQSDNQSTMVVADYTGRYIIVKAIDFLKVYLSYYGYYITTNYNQENDTIRFSFEKSMPAEIDIKLEDFAHERTLNDIKTNKVLATIKYETKSEQDDGWDDTTEVAYNNTTKKSIYAGSDAPDPSLYDVGWHLKLIQGYSWATATLAEYNAASNKVQKTFFKQIDGTDGGWQYVSSPDMKRIYMSTFSPPTGSCTVNNRTGIAYIDAFGNSEHYHCVAGSPPSCPVGSPSLSEMRNTVGGEIYDTNTVVRVSYRTTNRTCSNYAYIKVSYSAIAYYVRTGTVIRPRPNLPSKIYTLGRNNEVYEGNPPENQKTFPELLNIFESEFLADAQFNAIYYLISNRWVENIIIEKSMIEPVDISIFNLFQFIKIYDKNGESKTLPISEIHMSNDSYKIKLGFKKTSFTEIIKHDIGGKTYVTNQ